MSDKAQSHGDGCECTRCVGFEHGNQVAVGHGAPVQHGAYVTNPDAVAVVRFGEYVLHVAQEVRELLVADDLYSPSFEFTIQSLAIATWRRNVAATALEDAGAGERERLERSLRGWINTSDRLGNSLGMTPTARARLGLDVARKRREESLIDLAARAREEEAGSGEVAA